MVSWWDSNIDTYNTLVRIPIFLGLLSDPNLGPPNMPILVLSGLLSEFQFGPTKRANFLYILTTPKGCPNVGLYK